MEIIRIPKRYKNQLNRLTDKERLWIFDSLMSLADGEEVHPMDSMAGDILILIWREAILMEKKNGKLKDDMIGKLTYGQEDSASDLASYSHSKVKESKVKESKVTIATAIEFWEKNIGLLTEHICNELQYLEETHGEDNLLKAIKVAIESGVRNIRYVKGVLDKERGNNYAWVRQTKSNTLSLKP